MDEKLKRKKSSFDIGGLSNVEILNMRIEKNRSKIKLHEARKDLLSAYYSLIFLTRDFKGAEI
jgi:outer membrane protein TolC